MIFPTAFTGCSPVGMTAAGYPKITVTTVTAVTRRAEPPALHGFKRQ
ncbi:hypothetical protein ACMZ62_03100 [Streptococcus pluranimalium]